MNHLRLGSDDRVATVTMDRAPVNAVDQAMYLELVEVFSNVRHHLPDADVIILIGAGNTFCGGNDLHEFMTMTPENVTARMALVHAAFRSIYECEIPVIAAVDGVAAGTGVALAASADLVVATDRARFALPEISVGAMGGAKHLSRLVPQGVVRRMFYTAERVPASELARYGGIASVVPAEELVTTATALARSVARHSPVAIRIAKKSLTEIEYLDLQSGYAREQRYTGELSGYADAKEAVRAFFERREPRYTGM
ncbi:MULTISPECIES: enoyl-CoA hydratase-related protein [unclassified Nocardioides]|uniref:enoyl-CoA hydratase-related protein n=1 Tax=unclassified Nocardioides TaxID=2615069 RepID=UPI0019100139|nr:MULTISPECIES: enoyl-CoA hydratase-related protein [unclassified Nocardioides]